MCVHVCVHACVRACMRVCVCLQMHAPCSHAATNGIDYLGVSSEFVIDTNSIGITTQCMDYRIYDSFSAEEDETFTVTLSIISTVSIVAINNDVTTVIIRDIDRSCTLSGVADPGRGPLGTILSCGSTSDSYVCGHRKIRIMLVSIHGSSSNPLHYTLDIEAFITCTTL